ncbi:MAG: glycoside hydrolase family 97 C-terminal domain-containing protein, partial [Bacteroidales bacterium]|nr:glycoside hydrolase family 97 C-terminal domain-containing protein [Bacteroidales bacterium]
IFWYGKPYEYPNETEIEYFKELPTVWDDYVVLEGSPTEYFSIARKSGERWFVSSHTYKARTAELNLDFLEDGKNYNAVVYGDYASDRVGKAYHENLTKKSVLDFSLSLNGGAVAIITPENYPVAVQEPEPQGPEPQELENPEVIQPEPLEENVELAEDTEEEKPIETFVHKLSDKNISFKIYPNPAENIIKAETLSKRISIFDISGKKVLEITNFESSREIDVSGLKSGVYIISDGKKSVKFLKK